MASVRAVFMFGLSPLRRCAWRCPNRAGSLCALETTVTGHRLGEILVVRRGQGAMHDEHTWQRPRRSRPLGLTAAKRLTPTAYCLGMVVLVVPASCTAV
jgi:hypothetical protein